MEFKIKIKPGHYALRAYNKDGQQVYYTSTRLGGFIIDKDTLTCSIPDTSVEYELKDIITYKIVKHGKISDNKNVQDK